MADIDAASRGLAFFKPITLWCEGGRIGKLHGKNCCIDERFREPKDDSSKNQEWLHPSSLQGKIKNVNL